MMLRACILVLSVLAAARSQSNHDSGSKFSEETFVYKSVDDVAIKAAVYRPAGQERRPVIIWVHGV